VKVHIALALVAAVALIGACASPAGTSIRSPQSTGLTPSPASNWQTTPEVPLGAVGDLEVSPRAVYALYTPVGTQGKLAGAANVMVARIDRASGIVRKAGPFPGAFRLAIGAGGVWVGGGNEFPATPFPGAIGIVRLDPETLQELASVPLPPEPAQRALLAAIAAGSEQVWLAYGSHIYQLDPNTGAVQGKRPLSGIAASISFDSQIGRLYVGADAADGQAQATITEWSAATLGEVASADTGGASLGGPQVAAAGGDVWVAFATGMLGQIEHRRASDLTVLPSATSQYTNSVRVYLAGGFVWMTDGMVNRFACLDPHTGATLADVKLNLGAVLSGDREGLFVGDVNGVEALVPDARCRQQT
jgi:hypothetical protein